MTPPEELGVLAWLGEHLWAPVLALIGVAWKQNQTAMAASSKTSADALEAHAKDDEKQFKQLHDETLILRGHVGEIFQQMRQDGQLAEARHRELMTQGHASHTALLTALNAKADK